MFAHKYPKHLRESLEESDSLRNNHKDASKKSIKSVLLKSISALENRTKQLVHFKDGSSSILNANLSLESSLGARDTITKQNHKYIVFKGHFKGQSRNKIIAQSSLACNNISNHSSKGLSLSIKKIKGSEDRLLEVMINSQLNRTTRYPKTKKGKLYQLGKENSKSDVKLTSGPKLIKGDPFSLREDKKFIKEKAVKFNNSTIKKRLELKDVNQSKEPRRQKSKNTTKFHQGAFIKSNKLQMNLVSEFNYRSKPNSYEEGHESRKCCQASFINNYERHNIVKQQFQSLLNKQSNNTHKLTSTQVSREDNIAATPNSRLKVSEFFIQHPQLKQQISILEEPQTQPDPKFIRKAAEQNKFSKITIDKFNSFSPTVKKTNFQFDRRFDWRSAITAHVNHKNKDQIINRKVKELQGQPQSSNKHLQSATALLSYHNLMSPQKKNTLLSLQCLQSRDKVVMQEQKKLQFKKLKSRIIDNLNEVRTTETKYSHSVGQCFSSSKKVVEESIIMFKGSEDAILNQRLTFHQNSPKKQICLKLSYENQDKVPSEKSLPRRITQMDRENQDSIGGISVVSVIKSVEKMFKSEEVIYQGFINMVERKSIDSPKLGQRQALKARALATEMLNSSQIDCRNLREVYQELCYLLQKQYQKQKINPSNNLHNCKEQSKYRYIDMFWFNGNVFEINCSKYLLGKDLLEIQGELMLQLCSEVTKRQQNGGIKLEP